MLAVVLAAGCGKQLNPAFCDEHPNDPDCRSSGLVQIDAPPGECRESAMCAGNPNGNVCDTGSQTCVQCILGVDVRGCGGSTPQCGDDHLCHGCTLDAHCASSVCLPNGTCADETTVLYASQQGTGTVCSTAAPCTFTTAVAAVTAAKHIVKLLPSAMPYSEPPITIDVAEPTQILATEAIFEPMGSGDALTVTSPNVEIVGLTVRGATGSGVVCSGTSILSMRKMKVTDNSGFGIDSNGCTMTIERSRFSRNVGGGMSLVAGRLEVRNNIIDHGGNGGLGTGNVTIQNGNGRFVFNTIANNMSKGGGGRIGGIDCSPTSGLTMQVARNILADNGGGATFGGNCDADATTNYVGKVAEIKFSDAASYKLGPMSPTTILRDDPESGIDCMTGNKYIDDYEGESRPVNYCDRGADEFHPAP